MNILKRLPLFPLSNSSILGKITTPRLLKQKELHSSEFRCKKRSHYDGEYPPLMHSGGYKAYKFLFCAVAVPAILGMSVWTYREHQHKKKCYKRPPFVKYKYMYIRNKRFGWGDGNKTFFHNKEKNALPDGYED